MNDRVLTSSDLDAIAQRLLAVVERLRAEVVPGPCGPAGSLKERARPCSEEPSPRAAWHALGRRAEVAAEGAIRLGEELEEKLRIACQAGPHPFPPPLNVWDVMRADRFMQTIWDLLQPGWEGE